MWIVFSLWNVTISITGRGLLQSNTYKLQVSLLTCADQRPDNQAKHGPKTNVWNVFCRYFPSENLENKVRKENKLINIIYESVSNIKNCFINFELEEQNFGKCFYLSLFLIVCNNVSKRLSTYENNFRSNL